MISKHAALLAFAIGMAGSIPAGWAEPEEFMPRRQPDDRGRRAEKDAAALAKAERKRQRRAAKRMATPTD